MDKAERTRNYIIETAAGIFNGKGYDWTGGAVITRKSIRTKLPFFGPAIFPVFSILDPVYTYTLPEKQIADGVVDSFIHIMEQYLTFNVPGDISIAGEMIEAFRRGNVF